MLLLGTTSVEIHTHTNQLRAAVADRMQSLRAAKREFFLSNRSVVFGVT